jgi:DNA-binding LytR/AlgR family response regulator
MKTLIFEDEPLAAERLQLLLKQCYPNVEILSVISSVELGHIWLENNVSPNIIFMDIHLSDGSAFEILDKHSIQCPIVFTTAYDQYSLDVFEHFSIDYLLKPITKQNLLRAIKKLNILQQYQLPANNNSHYNNHYRTKFWGKIGTKLYLINIDDIAFFKSENKSVYLYTKQGQKLLMDYNLDELETLTNPNSFFRINRSHIVHCNSIEFIKPFIHQRYKTVLKYGQQTEEAVVSRERANKFKNWAVA